MAIKDRVIETLGLVSQKQLQEQLQEATHSAYIAGYNDGNDEPPSGTLASYGYRQNSTGGRRDNKLSWDELVNASWDMYNSNPPADRGLELKRDHILGRGVDVQTDDKGLEEIIASFRKVNRFDLRLREYVLQLFLFGIQCLPVAVRKSDGRVKLNYIDPQQVQDVLAHPFNPTELWAVVIKPMEGLPAWAGGNIPQRVYRIIREDAGYVEGENVFTPNFPERLVTAEQAKLEPWESAMLTSYGLSAYTGSCFYFHVNAVSNQPFGVSDLQRVIYWLGLQDETLLAAADRENSSGYWFTDVEMVGAQPEQVRQRLAELKRKPIQRASINVHNDREKAEIKQPTASAASVEVIDALFDYSWGGLGFPRHWYVQGDGTNRATAQEQAGPTEKTLQADQDTVKEAIEIIYTFVRDQAIIAGYPGLAQGEFKVIMPEVANKNLAALSQMLETLTNTLTTAIQSNFISEETTRDIWAKLLVEFGFEIDPVKEAQKIASEKEARAAEEAAKAEEERQKLIEMQKAGLAEHPDSDIGAAPTIEAATQIAIEKVRMGQPIDGSASIQEEINEAVRIAQSNWELEHNGKH